MPIPVVVWALAEITMGAIAAYEMYDVGKTIYEGVDEYTDNMAQAKEEIKKAIEAMEKEIGSNIDEKTEYAILSSLATADGGLQSENTRRAKGRGIAKGGKPLITTAIQQKIPFRKTISLVCAQANKVPVVSLRRKKGVELKDLPQAKKKILQEILRRGIENINDIENIDDFITVRLKQLMASHLFEFIDDMLDWKSPLKAEVSFGPAPVFADPPMAGGTKLLRRGNSFNPFYPMGHHQQKGSIAADLTISDYRHDPIAKDNLFAIVEIKFQKDTIENKQFANYDQLNRKSGKVKLAKVGGKARTHQEKGVTKGCRVSLFRFPEDMDKESLKDYEKNQAAKKQQSGSKKRL